MSEYIIDLATKFTGFPFGRYRIDGDTSAEVFRDDILIPALRQHNQVTVNLGGTNYYGSSFLEETFGGLVRQGFTKSELEEKLKIVHKALPSIEEEAWVYIKIQSGESLPSELLNL